MQAEDFLHLATDAIAANRGLIDTLGYRDAEAPLAGVGNNPCVQTKAGARNAFSLAEHGLEFGRGAQMRAAREIEMISKGRGSHGPSQSITMRRKIAAQGQTQRRARPLARRRARTLRPSAVAMRARKPWSRLRLMLLG